MSLGGTVLISVSYSVAFVKFSGALFLITQDMKSENVDIGWVKMPQVLCFPFVDQR